MKEAKLRAKQAQEMELLHSRGARGRDQLKRAHAQVVFVIVMTAMSATCMLSKHEYAQVSIR